MLLSFDVAPEAIPEHDDWHTHEHFPERLSIPGFLRGSRWIGPQGQPRYFVMYEVADLGVLTSPAYLERLNNPSPWTTKMMAHYRGMTRGLCTVARSFGAGLGQAALFVRFTPAPPKAQALRDWLAGDILPGLPGTPGLAGAHLFDAGVAPPSTSEQRIRGKDAAVDSALVVVGYDIEQVEALARTALGAEPFLKHGAAAVSGGVYRLAGTLSAQELKA